MNEDIDDHYDVRKEEFDNVQLEEVWNFDIERVLKSTLDELVGLVDYWVRELVGDRSRLPEPVSPVLVPGFSDQNRGNPDASAVPVVALV